MFLELSLFSVCVLKFADAVEEDGSAMDNSSLKWYEDLLQNGMTDKCYQTWILSILASCVVGLSGIVPLIFVPIDCGAKLNQQGKLYL